METSDRETRSAAEVDAPASGRIVLGTGSWLEVRERKTSAATSSGASSVASGSSPVEANPMIGYRGCYRYERRDRPPRKEG